jgi:S-DNA-T family DNA segregation ATPase FtsK/SpoIIIE
MQSAFVSDGEIEKISEFWRAQGEPEYKEEILAPETTAEHGLSSEEVDSLYREVLDFAREKGKISTSLIQRRFQIGYSRAARIMEQLEQNGIVGDQQAAGKPRDVIA